MPNIADWEMQPADEQDFNFIFTDYLNSMGEALSDAHTIDDVFFSGPDTELVIQSSTIHNGATLNSATECFIKVWLTGGTSGKKYKVTARIATFGGRVHEVEASVKVKDD